MENEAIQGLVEAGQTLKDNNLASLKLFWLV